MTINCEVVRGITRHGDESVAVAGTLNNVDDRERGLWPRGVAAEAVDQSRVGVEWNWNFAGGNVIPNCILLAQLERNVTCTYQSANVMTVDSIFI